MAKKIWKFPVMLSSSIDVRMPTGAEILSLQLQNDIPTLWALVEPGSLQEIRTFHWYGTGHSINDSEKLVFIGTIQWSVEELMFHLFEKINMVI